MSVDNHFKDKANVLNLYVISNTSYLMKSFKYGSLATLRVIQKEE